jgi:excisionase family DNA binding protein
MNFEPLINEKEAAALLGGLHPKTLQRMARTGRIPAYRVGRRWCFRVSELDKWLKSQPHFQRQSASRVEFITGDIAE